MTSDHGLRQTRLFVSGEDGYHTYRIPALVVAPGGALLAFCEGRRDGPADSGAINLLLKRSIDGGRTWGRQRVVWADGPNTCGNPCPVVDPATGTIWLLATWNAGEDSEKAIIRGASRDTRRPFVTCSRDEGLTWEAPREITSAVKPPDWTWYATGPGAGLCLQRGQHAGRLLIPCDHILAGTEDEYSHVIWSDDHGETWHLGGTVPRPGVDECEAVEAADGRLLLNMRSYDREQCRCRQMAESADGGQTWTNQRFVPALPDPDCQGSFRRYSWPEQGGNVVLFSNAADERERRNMTVRLSRDEGATWPVARVLHPGPSAYSCLAVLPSGEIACLYEGGVEHRREAIYLAIFTLPWLEG